MNQLTDDLEQIQQDFAHLLLADPLLAATPVNTFRENYTEDTLTQASAFWTNRDGSGNAGTAIQVLKPSLRAVDPNVPGPQFVIEQKIRVFELPDANTGPLRCSGLAIELLSWLDGMVISTGDSSVFQFYALPSSSGRAVLPNNDFEQVTVLDCFLVAAFPRSARARAQQAAISHGIYGEVILTPAPDNGVIYFTLDGSAPVAPLPGADAIAPTTLYTAPITTPPGTIVRWLAILPDCLPSFLGKYTVANP